MCDYTQSGVRCTDGVYCVCVRMYVCMCCLSLQLMDVRNAVVVVSRWYGGVHLGPDRFKHINNCARTVIQDTHIGLTVSSGVKESLLCARVPSHFNPTQMGMGTKPDGSHKYYCNSCNAWYCGLCPFKYTVYRYTV